MLAHKETRPFLDLIEEGDKVEGVVHYRDPFAAGGFLRIIRKGEVAATHRCWVS
jgi:hypothetical protein